MKVNLKKLQTLTQNLSVLYVEDDLNIQKNMALYLDKFFRSVVVADDGIQALEKFSKKKYDIIITDLSMPHMNGIEMIKKMKEIDENQPILITTAHGESGYLMEAIAMHTDGYIMKPFDFDLLNYELFKIAEKLSKYRENEEYKQHLQKMLQEQTQEMQENYEKTIYSMVELIEQRDTYTAGHSKRVAYYCELIAKEMEYSDDEVRLLHEAAILHDVGKIETPDAVLLNPNQLNEIEYKLIQEHVSVGFRLLDSIPMFRPLAPIVKEHHDRYDGTGYPDGLQGEEIHKLSRIMMVADAFDAMTTNRIYKGRKSISEALKELESLSAKQFHPEVVKSALVALKDIKIEANIDQLPKTKIEEERFAYFYNDWLTKVYNQNYLEVVLLRNDKHFSYMALFSLSHFTAFNKKYGWKTGDIILKEFAEILLTHFEEAIVFRIFGDDFVVINELKLSLRGVEKVLNNMLKPYSLDYKAYEIDLQKQRVYQLQDIEMLLR